MEFRTAVNGSRFFQISWNRDKEAAHNPDTDRGIERRIDENHSPICVDHRQAECILDPQEHQIDREQEHNPRNQLGGYDTHAEQLRSREIKPGQCISGQYSKGTGKQSRRTADQKAVAEIDGKVNSIPHIDIIDPLRLRQAEGSDPVQNLIIGVQRGEDHPQDWEYRQYNDKPGY
ncbi:hypothetical protein D3C80_1476240 [compost metagenome]